MNSTFLKTGAKQPMRGNFNLSYEKKFTCDMGELIPVLCEQMIPGDVFNINNAIMARCQPLVAPIMHEINIKTEYFFVPLRLIMGSLDEEDWQNFITGGIDGADTTVLDTWSPATTGSDEGSLWDYFGFPITSVPGTPIVPSGTAPLAFPRNAYNKIWNEWYRDEDLQTERNYDYETVAHRNWEKDYFCASLPFLQRGTAGALPVTGTLDIDSTGVGMSIHNAGDATDRMIELNTDAVAGDRIAIGTNPSASGNALWGASTGLVVDLSNSATFDISDLRLSAQVQKFQELNARAGVRLTEYLQAHFGVSVQDYRLQRSEFIGGTTQPLIVSEVLQTSGSATAGAVDVDTPQGSMSGHGISAGRNRIAKYRAPEHGILMGLMTIMPRTVYQQGINRQWLYESRWDWPEPLFVNLSEQEILQAEIYLTSGNASENETIFGYIGRYDELRVKQSMICSGMRSDFDHWHISRQFGSAPVLNASFLQCIPRKDIFAIPSEDGFIVNFGNIISAVRPIPTMNRPGVIGL